MEAHAKAGIKIQPIKTFLFRTEVEYLEHKINKDGIKMMDGYIDRIKNWPVPSSCKEVSTWLGFTGYYRSFIPLYFALTNSMNCLRKAEKFSWTEEMQEDFEQLKGEFQIGRVQSYPDFYSGEPFRLTTDWSADNIAGILSQVQEGKDRFLGCWGRKCSKYE